MTPEQEAARLIGAKGGNKTLEIHGKGHFKEISKKAVAVRKKNKLTKE